MVLLLWCDCSAARIKTWRILWDNKSCWQAHCFRLYLCSVLNALNPVEYTISQSVSNSVGCSHVSFITGEWTKATERKPVNLGHLLTQFTFSASSHLKSCYGHLCNHTASQAAVAQLLSGCKISLSWISSASAWGRAFFSVPWALWELRDFQTIQTRDCKCRQSWSHVCMNVCLSIYMPPRGVEVCVLTVLGVQTLISPL